MLIIVKKPAGCFMIDSYFLNLQQEKIVESTTFDLNEANHRKIYPTSCSNWTSFYAGPKSRQMKKVVS